MVRSDHLSVDLALLAVKRGGDLPGKGSLRGTLSGRVQADDDLRTGATTALEIRPGNRPQSLRDIAEGDLTVLGDLGDQDTEGLDTALLGRLSDLTNEHLGLVRNRGARETGEVRGLLRGSLLGGGGVDGGLLGHVNHIAFCENAAGLFPAVRCGASLSGPSESVKSFSCVSL